MNEINIKPFEILNNWQQHLNEANLSGILKLYDEKCVLIPTFSSEILTDHEQIKEYFVKVIEVQEGKVEFQPDSDTFGSVSMSIADGENMKVFYNRDLVDKIDEDSKDEWYAFLKEMKDFAVEHSLRFDVRDITKSNLTSIFSSDLKNSKC